jgi:hypothetical protein
MMLNPSVAKAGGLQSQGAEGDAVINYCKPYTTPDLESSGWYLTNKQMLGRRARLG